MPETTTTTSDDTRRTTAPPPSSSSDSLSDPLLGVAKMFDDEDKRAERASRTTDVDVSGVGKMFDDEDKRIERAERRSDRSFMTVGGPVSGLRSDQQDAADDYEATKGERQEKWETQVGYQHEWAQIGKRHAREDQDRRTRSEQERERVGTNREGFTLKIGALKTELNELGEKIAGLLGRRTRALSTASGISAIHRSYDPTAATALDQAVVKVDGSTNGLDRGPVDQAVQGLETTQDNSAFKTASKAKRAWATKYATAKAAYEEGRTELNAAKIKLDDTAVKAARLALVEQAVTDGKLSPRRQNQMNGRIQSSAPKTKVNKTAFVAYLNTEIESQHTLVKGQWLDQLGFTKWGRLWGLSSAGSAAGYNVHASLYKDGMPGDAKVTGPDNLTPVPLSTLADTLLGTGTGGLHVTMEVHGQYGTSTKKNPHAYRGGIVHKNDYRKKGSSGVDWSTAKTQLEGVRASTIGNAEAAIKAVIDAKGEI